MSAPAPPAARARWLMWGLPSFLFLIAFFHRAAPGVIARELMQEFAATGTVVGLLAATYFYSYAGGMLPAGVLIDAYGPRRIVAAGGAVMGAGTLAMALAAAPGPLFAGRLVVGLGATATFIGAMKIAAAWFPPARFGTLSALTATVGVLGSIVSNAPLAALVAWAGWRGAFALVGVVTLAGALACVLLVRDRPSEAGPTGATAPGLRAVLAGTGRVLGNPHTWPPFLAFFFMYAAMGNLMLWAVPYLRDVYRLGTTEAAGYATITAAVLLVSAPATGWLSDVLGRRKPPYLGLTLASCALWAVQALTAGTLPLAGVALLWGLLGLVGGAFVLTWPIGREANPPELAGSAVAVVNLGGFVGAAFTQGVLGAVLDARWTGATAGGARVYPTDAYQAAFWVCTGFVAAAAVMAGLVRERGPRAAPPAGRAA